MRKLSLVLILILLTVAAADAQQRDKRLTIQVTSADGDQLQGQLLTLLQTDYDVSYGQLRLNAEGLCVLNAYAGAHRLIIERDGFEVLSHDFTISDDATELTVSVTLTEKIRQPFALTATPRHNAYTGQDDIDVAWNTEAPAFFDDFESYTPFAIEFGEWTGIDADMAAAAALIGSYPNRGVMQYAQIINPLAVEPTWWYDYPILRPYSGQQYVGFTRTNTGVANDDWLISPVITVGTDNVLQFMGKAADQYTERFMVYVTTQTEQPVQTDFVRIDQDNYETADYRGWRKYTYDLSAYAGRQIKFAIRYISDYNRYRSFMLMIDDVYVGQETTSDMSGARSAQASRRAPRCAPHGSPLNPNETFLIYLDNLLVGTTDGYKFTIEKVEAGQHTVGVQAVYLQTQSDISTVPVDVPAAQHYAHVIFHVTAQSILTPDGQQLRLLSKETAETYVLTVSDGRAEISSLPVGQYVASVEQGAFEALQQTVSVEGDSEFNIVLHDYIMDPYNITATTGDDGLTMLRWNQELGFADSFEDYDDFATGTFGDWTTIDQDLMPVYPIALGSPTNIISFPGSGTANNPMPIAPMVFNPWHTSPPMLPDDPAIAAPTGDKTVIFFSPQRSQADKWLISPLLDIRDGYLLSVKAKAYEPMYPETMAFCVSDGSTQPADFRVLSEVNPVSGGAWTRYVTDLSDFAGQQVRLAVHYTSTDAFLLQIDDFAVGPEEGQGETLDYGNVVRFDIYLDGTKVGQSATPSFVIGPLSEGRHVVGIQAIYRDGQSAIVEYIIEATNAIASPAGSPAATAPTFFDLSGRRINQHAPVRGFYLTRQPGITRKIIK